MSFLFNLFIIIADQLMLFGINVLVARSAGASLFGDFTVATNALYLIATIMTFGIDSIIAYYVPKFYIKERYERIFALTISVKNFLTPIHITILLLGVTLSIAIIALSRALEHLHFFEINHPLMLFLWGAVAISLYHIYIQYLQAIDYMRMSVLLSLLQTVFYFILSLFTYFYLYSILFHHDRNYFPHIMLMAFILSYVLILLTVPLMYKKLNWRYYPQQIFTIYNPCMSGKKKFMAIRYKILLDMCLPRFHYWLWSGWGRVNML